MPSKNFAHNIFITSMLGFVRKVRCDLCRVTKRNLKFSDIPKVSLPVVPVVSRRDGERYSALLQNIWRHPSNYSRFCYVYC